MQQGGLCLCSCGGCWVFVHRFLYHCHLREALSKFKGGQSSSASPLPSSLLKCLPLLHWGIFVAGHGLMPLLGLSAREMP